MIMQFEEGTIRAKTFFDRECKMNPLLSTWLLCFVTANCLGFACTDSGRLPAAVTEQTLILSMQVQRTGIFPSMRINTRLCLTQDRRF